MSTESMVTQADFDRATEETNRLCRELDITNADHIALWIEHNTIPDEPMNQCASWLACRIVEAHEAARRTAAQPEREAGEVSDERISSAEMVEMFGSEMPIEAVNLLWSVPDNWTIADVRRELRRIATLTTPAPAAQPEREAVWTPEVEAQVRGIVARYSNYEGGQGVYSAQQVHEMLRTALTTSAPAVSTEEIVAGLGPYTVPIRRCEDYSGEHREWVENYTIPQGDPLIREIAADILSRLRGDSR